MTALEHGWAAGHDDRLHLIERMTFEVVPLKSIDAAIDALPPQSSVSVTCSPVKGIAETVALTDQIRGLGHTAIPHIAARMVESRRHTDELARWLRTEDIGQIFVVGGDAESPNGPYTDAVSFLLDLLNAGPALDTVGVTSYPNGHSAIADQVLSDALHEKQEILADAGIAGYASTQMCFDPDTISKWITAERGQGLTLPIHLGIPGVVDRTKLMTMGVRLGIGTSLRYVKKNRRAISRLLKASDFDPDTIIEPLIGQLKPLGVEAIHCFTFNQVEPTKIWRQNALATVKR